MVQGPAINCGCWGWLLLVGGGITRLQRKHLMKIFYQESFLVTNYRKIETVQKKVVNINVGFNV